MLPLFNLRLFEALTPALPARREAADEGVIRAVEVRLLATLGIEAQLEAQPLPAEQAEAVAEPVVPSRSGGPDADPRRADKAATDRHAVAEVRGQASAGRMATVRQPGPGMSISGTSRKSVNLTVPLTVGCGSDPAVARTRR